jgi:lipopolysaccharide export system protein LptA
MALPAVLATALVLLASPAVAQGGGRGHDSGQPVQINADNLEVQQDKKIAIFKGNVDATQGDLRLKTDLLRVFYTEERGQKSAGGTTGASGGTQSGGPGSNTKITRLEAEGHVFISRPDQTGKGDRGVYDLEKRTIVLEGNVVLTDRENVVTGVRATMDLNTRQSTVQSGSGGRVQGVFQQKSQ